jgi:hypothetical protein
MARRSASSPSDFNILVPSGSGVGSAPAEPPGGGRTVASLEAWLPNGTTQVVAFALDCVPGSKNCRSFGPVSLSQLPTQIPIKNGPVAGNLIVYAKCDAGVPVNISGKVFYINGAPGVHLLDEDAGLTGTVYFPTTAFVGDDSRGYIVGGFAAVEADACAGKWQFGQFLYSDTLATITPGVQLNKCKDRLFVKVTVNDGAQLQPVPAQTETGVHFVTWWQPSLDPDGSVFIGKFSDSFEDAMRDDGDVALLHRDAVRGVRLVRPIEDAGPECEIYQVSHY